jgi:uncharacterized repeat protein (TIGR01451 family)/uncharacterized delta-60 repeat protein
MKHIFNFILVFFVVNCIGQKSTGEFENQIFSATPITLSCNVGGITVTSNSPGSDFYVAPSNAAYICSPSAAYSGMGNFSLSSDWNGFITFSFSTPITSGVFTFGAVNCNPGIEKLSVSTNGNGILSYQNLCGFTSLGNILTCSYPTIPGNITSIYGNASVKVASTVPFTSITFTSASNFQSGGVVSSPCRVFNLVTCPAGNNAPILTATTINNTCPNMGVNLNSITATNTPANSTLTWHTVTPVTGANQVANPSAAPAGTYYAAFYNAANNCYSPTSTAVTAVVNQCLADLTLNKKVNNNNYTPLVGGVVSFTLTASNSGPSAATGVVVTDNIPTGYTFISATPSVGTWNSVSNTWTIGNLAVGASASLLITTTVNGIGNHLNTATVAGNQTDPFPKSNKAEDGVGIIYAVADNFTTIPVNGCTGGSTTTSVLSNDWYNDNLINPTEPAMPIVTLLNNGGLSGVTISNNGIITIPAGSPFGDYTITYNICRYYEPTICSQATVTIRVSSLPLVANNDDFSSSLINTLTGGNTPTVFSNDTFNGVAVTASNVVASINGSVPVISPTPEINPDGTIAIPVGTTNGTYTITYTIRQSNCLMNMSTASATIVVGEQVIVTDQIAPGTRANLLVRQVDTQSTGKIIITGSFTTYNNITSLNIARLNTNLTFDPTFFVTGSNNQRPYDMKVIKNSGIHYNKVLLVGAFTGFNNGSNGVGIIRLNTDGTVDTTFNVGGTGVSGSNDTIYCCYIYPDGSGTNTGKILIGGMFEGYNGTPVSRIARLNVDGTIDLSFDPNVYSFTPRYTGPGFNSAPIEILVQPDGKILVGGFFTHFNGVRVNNITRLNDDATLDESFNPYTATNRGLSKNITDSKFNTHIEDIVLDSNNNIIIGGVFQFYNGTSSNNIARLLPNGLIDPSFAVGTGFNNTFLNVPAGSTYGLVRDLDIDGTKIYVAGDFTAYKGVACDEMIRLFSNGNIDSQGFNLLTGGTNGYVWCMKRQGDGKIIIGGQFTMYSTFSALNVTRIFPSNPSSEARMGATYYDAEPDATAAGLHDAITLYPNPTTGKLYIANEDVQLGAVTIRLYSLLGQKVLEQALTPSTLNEIDLTSLQKGTYFTTFTTEKETVTKTIVIK